MREILFYGDSNTWGYIPGSGERYKAEQRYVGVAQKLLGSGYHCIAAGLNGRTTVYDDPCRDCRNGRTGLDQELLTHKPLDLLVIMLGTNDLLYAANAAAAARGAASLITMAKSANLRCASSSKVFPGGAKILLIAPPLIGTLPPEDPDTELMPDAEGESRRLGARLRRVAEEEQVYFLDAGPIAEVSPLDAVHLTENGHAALGKAAAEKIREIFGK